MCMGLMDVGILSISCNGYGQSRRGAKWPLGNTCLVQVVQGRVGNGALWPWRMGRNVVMS